jgi:hypothetical protein
MAERCRNDRNLIIDRATGSMDAGDDLGAAQAFAEATAVAAAYALGTAWGFGTAFPISGLSSALRNLSESPGMVGSFLAKSGLVRNRSS